MKSFEENPFAQAEQLMRIEFALAGEAKQIVPVAIEELAYAYRWDNSGETLLVYLDEADAQEMRAQVTRLQEAGFDVIEASAGRIEPEDWVAQSQASFPPMYAGRFFVHGDNFNGTPPEGAHVIAMNAGGAFGTGEHATTSGCLKAISALDGSPSRVLDMGCGTAILAIAMVKRWPSAQAIAVDLDAVAVRVSEENVAANAVSANVQCAQSDGYQAPRVSDHAPYDVIAANILANPLMGMARDCSASLAKGGYAILSGFTEPQVTGVIVAHEAAGLTHLSTEMMDGWATSVLQKQA